MYKPTKNKNTNNMRTHIVKAYSFLEEHLPHDYAIETQRLLKRSKIKVTLAVIRNVRNKQTTTNTTVLNALLKVARKHKKANEILSEQLQEQ